MKKLLQHKVVLVFIIIVILILGYSGIKAIIKNKSSQTRYVITTVEKGTIISSISGSGQVSASDQVDVKSKASSDVIFVNVKNGQDVKAGTLLVQLDSQDAQRAVRDAETSLETAKLELDKLVAPVDELTLLQAEDSLNQAEISKEKAEDNLDKAYEDGFNTVSSAFLNLPTIMSGLDDMFFSYSIEPTYLNIDWYYNQISRWEDYNVLIYKNDANTKYTKAKQEYETNFADYKKTSRDSSNQEIEDLISETYETTRDIAESIKSFKNYTDFVKETLTDHGLRVPAIINTHQTSLDSSTQQVNSYLTSLLSARQNIKDDKQAIVNAETSIKEKTLSLADTKNGPDELDVRAKKIAVQQKKDALLSAQQTLADYSIRAPFDGQIAALNVKKGDSVSSGTTIATFISKQSLAAISLNEIDAAKVQVGQKVTMTFDAVPDLTIVGEVAQVDMIGTVSQGVVTYAVKIQFNTQDERVKPGMSVNTDIITNIKQDVLLVPNSAIKTQNGASYVLVPDEILSASELASGSRGLVLKTSPRRQMVQVGLSDDTSTEITSGLTEGEQIITSSTNATTTSSSTTTGRSILQTGGNRGGGGAIFMGR